MNTVSSIVLASEDRLEAEALSSGSVQLMVSGAKNTPRMGSCLSLTMGRETAVEMRDALNRALSVGPDLEKALASFQERVEAREAVIRNARDAETFSLRVVD